MSRPHFHPNDRLIVVLSGTWWVGTGDVFDPNSTVPMRAGTYVTHYAKKIHYDGAKDEDTIIQIHGHRPGGEHAGGTQTLIQALRRNGPRADTSPRSFRHKPESIEVITEFESSGFRFTPE